MDQLWAKTTHMTTIYTNLLTVKLQSIRWQDVQRWWVSGHKIYCCSLDDVLPLIQETLLVHQHVKASWMNYEISLKDKLPPVWINWEGFLFFLNYKKNKPTPLSYISLYLFVQALTDRSANFNWAMSDRIPVSLSRNISLKKIRFQLHCCPLDILTDAEGKEVEGWRCACVNVDYLRIYSMSVLRCVHRFSSEHMGVKKRFYQ